MRPCEGTLPALDSTENKGATSRRAERETESLHRGSVRETENLRPREKILPVKNEADARSHIPLGTGSERKRKIPGGNHSSRPALR
jgi:hypothetical protein